MPSEPIEFKYGVYGIYRMVSAKTKFVGIVVENSYNGQKTVTVPKDSSIRKGDAVVVRRLRT